jgi:hypothetical protein
MHWCVFDWELRNDPENKWPAGPNYWSEKGVFVDEKGWLHLKIQQDEKGRWQCAELFTKQRLLYGEYKWDVAGCVMPDGTMLGIQNLDKQAVLGLFQYPSKDVGPDRTHEIDVELSYWGKEPKDYPYFMNWSSYTTDLKINPAGQKWFGMDYGAAPQRIGQQTHSYYRTKDGINWKAQYNNGQARCEYYQSRSDLSRASMPVYMNLWLEGGKAPSGPVEVVLKSFTYSAQK